MSADLTNVLKWRKEGQRGLQFTFRAHNAMSESDGFPEKVSGAACWMLVYDTLAAVIAHGH